MTKSTPCYHINIALRLTLHDTGQKGSFRSHHIYKSHDQHNAFMPTLIKLFVVFFLRETG